MFSTAFISPGGTELLIVMLALILLFGAKDAPKIFRRIQGLLDKTQRAAASFRYKVMYGDIQNNSQKEASYNPEIDYPEEEGTEDTEPPSNSKETGEQAS